MSNVNLIIGRTLRPQPVPFATSLQLLSYRSSLQKQFVVLGMTSFKIISKVCRKYFNLLVAGGLLLF